MPVTKADQASPAKHLPTRNRLRERTNLPRTGSVCGRPGRSVVRAWDVAPACATGGSPLFMLGDMTIQRMDNVAIVVEDLDAAVAFFAELGMELEGKGQIEGPWADRTVGLDGVRSHIAMMRTPDGHSKLELTKYQTPAAVGTEPENPPPNTLGLHRVMFAVDDIDDTVARMRAFGLPGRPRKATATGSVLCCAWSTRRTRMRRS